VQATVHSYRRSRPARTIGSLAPDGRTTIQLVRDQLWQTDARPLLTNERFLEDPFGPP
jgi:hypothetical protein